MTDEELLETAARAAGLPEIAWTSGAWTFGEKSECRPGNGDVWNPLTDDGDAMRLAVKLGLAIDTHATRVCYGETVDIDEPGFRDAAATRRAIVRAAAEIGSSHNAEVSGLSTRPPGYRAD